MLLACDPLQWLNFLSANQRLVFLTDIIKEFTKIKKKKKNIRKKR